MANLFKRAQRHQLRLRMAIDGPSGAGKSVTALRMAMALANGDPDAIAVIDTESGSASKYIGEDYGEGPIEFDVLELKTFSPSSYTAAINEAGRLGKKVIVVDSLSHAWEGKDGALELVNKAGGNSYTGWKDVTPMHQAMIQSILNSPAHVICTMRSKTDYVLEPDSNGKMVPRKIGMAPVQRAGMEYEFDVYLAMDWSHIGKVTKSRCSAIDGITVVKPGAEFMAPISQWLTTGTPRTSDDDSAASPAGKISDEQLEMIVRVAGDLLISIAAIEKTLPQKFGCQRLAELDYAQAGQLYISLLFQKKQAAERAAAIAANEQQTVATEEQTAAATSAEVAGETAKAKRTRKPKETPAAGVENSAATTTVTDVPLAQEPQVEALKWIGRTSGRIPLDRWLGILAKRDGATDESQLTFTQAAELILGLKTKWPDMEVPEFGKAIREANAAAGTPSVPAAVAAQKPAAGVGSDIPFAVADPAEAEPSNAAVVGKATTQQVEDMIRYRDELGISLVQWSAILAKKNVAFEGDLSPDDADVFLANLQKKLHQKAASAGMKEWGNAVAPDPATAGVATKN